MGMLYGFGMHILWTTVDFEQWMIDIYRFLLYLVGYITNNLIQVFLFGNGAGTFSKMVINHQIWEQTYTVSRVCLDRTTAANKTISKSIGIPFEKWSTNINCSLCQIFLKGTLVGRSEIVQKCPWNTCWISHVPHVFFWGFPMETHGWFATDFSMDRRTEDPCELQRTADAHSWSRGDWDSRAMVICIQGMRIQICILCIHIYIYIVCI